MSDYPDWRYFPPSSKPPQWAHDFVAAVYGARGKVDSSRIDGLTSDKVLAELRPGLEQLGYAVEAGKRAEQKIRRPVLFGDGGSELVAYEVDAVHDELKILVEVEAGRGARGNAVYRDLIRSSLVVDVDYLVLGVMVDYRHKNKGKTVSVASYNDARAQLDAIYASGRLGLPFKGILLFGY